MRSLIRLLVVLLICLIGIGFYRGWFSLSAGNADPEGKKVNVNMSVDKEKMRSDVKETNEKVKDQIKDLEGKVHAKEKAK